MKSSQDYARLFVFGVLMCLLVSSGSAVAQVFSGDPKPDVTIVGPTRDPADIRDEGLKQQNEPACAVRPGDSDCIICFFNDYRTVDILGHEDAWIASAMSCDGANTWSSRVVPNHPTHPVPVGFKFAADPRVVAIPGMAIHAFIVGDRTSDEGSVLVQHWLENNKDDADFYEPGLNPLVVDTGAPNFFLDKPDLLGVVHPITVFTGRGDDDDDDDECDDDDDDDDYYDCFSTIDTITLSTQMENTALGTITREYPTGTLYAAYTAFFSDTRSQLLVKTSQDWGVNWSTSAVPLTDGNSLVSGLTLTSKGNKVLAMWREVGEGTAPDAVYYSSTSVGSNSWSTPSKLTDICTFDQPSATFTNQVTFRTNDFPWLANDGKNFYAFYTDRQGDCATGTPKIVVSYSGDGVSWSAPQAVANTPGAQFMPSAFGANGKVQFAWYDTSREMVDVTPLQPFIADFIPTSGVRVNRKVDVYTARITADASGGPIQVSEPVRVSQYRAVASASDAGGPLQEIEASFANAQMFKSGELSFLGDYFAVAAPEFRQDGAGGWESNASAAPPPASNLVDFFIAYADNRDVRGDVLFDGPGPNSPYTPPKNLPATESTAAVLPGDKAESPVHQVPVVTRSPAETADAEGIIDFFTDPNTVCTPGTDADRTRDSNIYGSVIRDTLRLSSPVESRPLSGILRAIPVLANNVTDEYVPYRLFIANQPAPDPVWNRASFRQKPDRAPFTSTNYPDLPTLAPVLTEDFVIAPRSSIARTVFLVAQDIGATVDVQIFDGDCAAQADFDNPTNPVAFASACPVLGSINVGGTSNAGDLQQPDYLSSVCAGDPACANVQVTELHNPLIENPLIQNPLIQNPLIKNPLIKNMQVQAPLIQNPLIQNPLIQNFGFENPLIQNPLIQNPLIQNPLIQNPLIQNPLIQNPLIQNSALAANDITFTDRTVVLRNDGNVTTAYNVDATTAGFTSTGDGAPVSQLILWKQYAYGTARDCAYLPEVRNQVVTTINSFDDTLSVASIDDPFAGEASIVLAPGEQGFATIRIWGTESELDAASLSKFTVSSQAANCDEFDDTFGPPAGQEDDFYTCQDQLNNDQELILLDLDTSGPTFDNLVDGQTIPVPAIEANAPGGACLQPIIDGLVSASDPGSGVASIACFNSEGDQICLAAGETGLSVPVSNLSIYPAPQPSEATCIAEDTVGNTTEINIFFDVVDNTAPVFTSFPANPTNANADSVNGEAFVNLEAGVAAQDVNSVDPDPDVSCRTTTNLTSNDPIPAGTYTAFCTATDASGNSTDSPPFVVNVSDVTPPVITLIGPNPQVLEAGAPFTALGATASDNVGLASATVDIDASAVIPNTVGDYPVIYTISDTSGLTTTETRTVSVVDGTPPELDLPADFAVNAIPTGDNAIVPYVATANDNATGAITVTCVPPSGSSLPIGVTTVTCTATDAQGNESTASFDVEVVDVTPPAFTVVPAPITISASANGDAFVDYDVIAADNSGFLQSLVCTPPAQSVFPLGETIVNCTATDAAGNAANASFTVTVVDDTAPAVTIDGPNPLTLEAGDPVPNPTVDAVDNVGVDGPITVTGVVDTLTPGQYTLTYSAEDAAGNVGTAELVVNIVDTTPPNLALPAPISVSASANGDAIVTFDVTATDNAAGDPDIDCDPPSGSVLGIGVTTVFCTATDAAGLTTDGTFTITVVDDTPPEFTSVPGPISVSAVDANGAPVTYTVTATDNSGLPPIIGCTPLSGATFPLGTTAVMCSATDGSGNVSTAGFSVTIADTTPPVVTVNGDDPLEVIAGTVFDDPGATATDNVDAAVAVVVSGSVNTSSPGSYVLTYTAEDAAGNVASASRVVNVVDRTPPVITALEDPLEAVFTSSAGAVVNFDGNVSATDDIDPSPSIACSPVSGSTFPAGTTTVTCTATDASGNSAAATFIVSVGYDTSYGLVPKKRNSKAGSSNPLKWAWRDASGNNVDTSNDMQMLSIVKCNDPSMVVLDVAGDPGTSGFRFGNDFVWQFNWQSDWPDTGQKLPKGEYCARVESSLTGQAMTSPSIRLR